MYGCYVKEQVVAMFMSADDCRHWANERFLPHEWLMVLVSISDWQIEELQSIVG